MSASLASYHTRELIFVLRRAASPQPDPAPNPLRLGRVCGQPWGQIMQHGAAGPDVKERHIHQWTCGTLIAGTQPTLKGLQDRASLGRRIIGVKADDRNGTGQVGARVAGMGVGRGRS
jgi:hypothetical protein